jgi:hypothetical protein
MAIIRRNGGWVRVQYTFGSYKVATNAQYLTRADEGKRIMPLKPGWYTNYIRMVRTRAAARLPKRSVAQKVESMRSLPRLLKEVGEPWRSA